MESAYAATLPVRERRLAGRLEGFGDIVFGFAVSQCALQLPTVDGHADIAHPGSLLAYFGTFAILATLWLTFHDIISSSFRPTRLDLLIAFSYLAFVTLMPYAMYSISHSSATLQTAGAAFAEYTIIFTALLFSSATITLRNLRRGYALIEPSERNRLWTAVVRRSTIGMLTLVAFAADLEFGPVNASLVFLAMIALPKLAKTFAGTAPSSAWLRIEPVLRPPA